MTKRKLLLGALAAGAIALSASGAQAAILLENWTFDARNIDGLSNDDTYNVGPVDQWSFQAHFQQNIVDDNGNFFPDVGEEGVVNGRGFITGMQNDGSATESPLLNETSFFGLDGYEVTFEFAVDYVVTDVDADDVNFTHTTANNASGQLIIYVDNLNDGAGSQCATAGANAGTGCDDGTVVAIFDILDGEGGNINFDTLDGSDDATFAASFLLAGVWFDEFGEDLGCDDAVIGSECEGDPLAMTAGTLDSDLDGNGLLDTDSAVFDCGIDPQTGLSSPIRTCGQENGSYVLATVPEPTTLGILSLGLVMLGGFAGYSRRRG